MAIFTSATNTGSTEATLIAKIVQDQLLNEAKLMATVTDFSDYAKPGYKTIEIPKWSSGFSGPEAQNVDGATGAAFQTATFATDTLNLDQWVNLPYAVPDRISEQSAINLKAKLAESAGREMAIWLDEKIIAAVKAVSATAPDHKVQLTGASNLVLTLEDIANSRMLLNKQNVPQSDRYLVISPEQEKAMLKLDNFVRADAYGARDGLLNGEIGRVFGFTVIVHNALASDDMLAYHKSHAGFAIQKALKFEEQRGSVTLQRDEYSFSMGAGFVTLDGGKRGVHYNSAL